MKSKLRRTANKAGRFLLTVLFGVDYNLTEQFPDDTGDYQLYIVQHWRGSDKGQLLVGLWLSTLALWVCVLLGAYYADAAVLFYGWIRLTSIMVNTAAQDYLDYYKEKHWRS